jgi:hypothetical protein
MEDTEWFSNMQWFSNTLVGALEVIARRSACFEDRIDLTAVYAQALLPLSPHNVQKVHYLSMRYISTAEAIDEYSLLLRKFATAREARRRGG